MTVSARSAKTRSKIMEAASDLFYRQGYEATVVTQIIKEAGISKPTFYEYFPPLERLAASIKFLFLGSSDVLDILNLGLNNVIIF